MKKKSFKEFATIADKVATPTLLQQIVGGKKNDDQEVNRKKYIGDPGEDIDGDGIFG